MVRLVGSEGLLMQQPLLFSVSEEPAVGFVFGVELRRGRRPQSFNKVLRGNEFTLVLFL